MRLTLLLLLLPGTPPRPADEPFEKAVRPYLEAPCVRCHGGQKQKREFRVDTLPLDFAGAGAAGRWGDVIERLNTGEMPPKGEPKPTAEASAKVVEWLTARLKEGEAARHAKRERVALRKLTREEYANTVFDLPGVRYDAADPTGHVVDYIAKLCSPP